MGNAAQVIKGKCLEQRNGSYSVEFKILTASSALQFRLRVLNRVVFVRTVESRAGQAKAKTSEAEMIGILAEQEQKRQGGREREAERQALVDFLLFCTSTK